MLGFNNWLSSGRLYYEVLQNGEFMEEIKQAVKKCINGDSGILDKHKDSCKLKHEEEVLGIYKTSKGNIYIVNSPIGTIILFANEEDDYFVVGV